MSHVDLVSSNKCHFYRLAFRDRCYYLMYSVIQGMFSSVTVLVSLDIFFLLCSNCSWKWLSLSWCEVLNLSTFWLTNLSCLSELIFREVADPFRNTADDFRNLLFLPKLDHFGLIPIKTVTSWKQRRRCTRSCKSIAIFIILVLRLESEELPYGLWRVYYCRAYMCSYKVWPGTCLAARPCCQRVPRFVL
jgi:hypothetical protein